MSMRLAILGVTPEARSCGRAKNRPAARSRVQGRPAAPWSCSIEQRLGHDRSRQQSQDRLRFPYLAPHPGAAALRGGKRAADHSHRGSQRCTGRGARPADGVLSRHPIYRGKQARYNGFLGPLGCDGERASHCAPQVSSYSGPTGKPACPTITHPGARHPGRRILGAHTGNAWIDRDVDA